MIRVCIIGVSGYGAVHLQLLRERVATGEVQIVGATVINQDEEVATCAWLRDHGCALYTDAQAMCTALSGRADLCMIPTGTPLHRPMTIAALEAGMHVLVEKPAAGCVADVSAMQAAEVRSGRRVAVGYQHLYSDAVHELKRELLGGTIGSIISMKMLALWPRDYAYYQRNRWAGRLMLDEVPVYDSPFNNALAHELIMMLFLAGPAARSAAPIRCAANLYRVNAIESADTASLLIETSSGVPLWYYASHACSERRDPTITITGTTGSVVVKHQAITLTPQGSPPRTLPIDNPRHAMLSAVLQAVRGEDDFLCTLEIARQQTIVIEQVHRASPVVPMRGQTSMSPTGPRTTLPGIEASLREAYADERLLALIG